MTDSIPEALKRCVSRTGAVANGAKRVVLEQRGTMRLKPDGKWVPFTATQWMAVREVGFCWHARVKMAPLVTAVVDDAYQDGHGRLDAKVWGVVPIAHGEGADVDRGQVQRYLAELPWNPGAVLSNPDLHFEERPHGAVRVWTVDPSRFIDLVFDESGDIVRTFCDNRPLRDRGPTSWEGRFADYEEHGGLRVPTRGEVAWLLPDGVFTYWRGDLVGLEQS
jgi:hypothetical protein